MRPWIAVALVACHTPAPPTTTSQPVVLGKLGVQVDAPAGATVDEKGNNFFVTSGTFKLNVFTVDEYSAATADEQRTELQNEPGFVRFTTEQPGAKTWRFDYELERGKAGTVARIDVGHPLDCGVHGVAPAVAADVARACASLRKP